MNGGTGSQSASLRASSRGGEPGTMFTPRSAEIASLQAQLAEAQQALAKARLQEVHREQAEQDNLAATAAAQQVCICKIAFACSLCNQQRLCKEMCCLLNGVPCTEA